MCSMSILNKIVDRYRVAQLIIAIVIETFMSLGAKSTIDEEDDDDDDDDDDYFYFLYLLIRWMVVNHQKEFLKLR